MGEHAFLTLTIILFGLLNIEERFGNEKGFEIAEIEVVTKDHIHVFVSAIPKISISYIAKMMKGISGRLLLKEFPEISKELWNGELWNPSYYVETIGSISEEAIREYIQEQEKE